MFSPEIQAILQEFSIGLHSSLPLKNYWEYFEANDFNREAHVEKSKAIQNLRETVFMHKPGPENRECAETFRIEVEKLIDAHRIKNEDLRNQAQSLLKKRTEELCADFKFTFQANLLLNPNIELKTIEELLETGKKLGKSYFEYHSIRTPYHCLYNQDQMKEEELLVKELQSIENAILQLRRDNWKSLLDDGDRKLLAEKIHSLLKGRVGMLYMDFKSSLETKLLIAPDMDLMSLGDLIETGKELVKRYFEYHSNLGMYNKRQEQMNEQNLLDQVLEMLGTGIFNEQIRHMKFISSEEEKKLLERLKEGVREMCEKVKVDSRNWTKRKYELNLKEGIEEIRNYVNENGGKVLFEGNSREILKELVKLQSGEEMTTDEFITWTEGLNKEVTHEIKCEPETPETHFLDMDSDTDEDAPKVEGNIKLEFGQTAIKKEVVEMDYESSSLEFPMEMDIDVKIELGDLVVHKSSLNPTQTHVQNPAEGNLSAQFGYESAIKDNLIEDIKKRVQVKGKEQLKELEEEKNKLTASLAEAEKKLEKLKRLKDEVRSTAIALIAKFKDEFEMIIQ